MNADTSRYVPDYLIKINGKKLFQHGTALEVLSISVTETINRADSFQLQLRARHSQLEHFPTGGELQLLDDKQFEPGNDVEIEMGYRDNRTLKLIGKITAIAVNFPEGGIPTLTVQGLSLFDRLNRKHRRKPFASKNDSAIVKEIADEFGLKAEVEELKTKHKTVSYKDKTYASILLERAKRLNFEVAVKQKSLIFKRPVYLENSKPQLTLTWGRTLRSFSPRISSSNIPTLVEIRSSQTARGGNKKPIVGLVKGSSVPAELANKSGLQYVLKWFEEVKILSTETRAGDSDEAGKIARAQLEQSALNFVSASGSANGDPELVSRKVIKMEGLGKRFSGSYYVTSTTHTINASGYQTTFEAKRDGYDTV